MNAYEDTNFNWRVRRGYGALVAAYGASCPLALNCAVTLIDHSQKHIRIETSRGTLTADRVIVTVPTNLIADEAIRFHPPLPAKVDAARGLPLGLADKVTLALAEPDALPKEGNLRGATMRTSGSTARNVRSPTSTSPGSAACWRRAARLTASPVTRKSRPGVVPVTTRPVLTPIRRTSGTARRSATAASRERMRRAARTARSASSSCATGTPKTAMTASPMNFSTVPPYASAQRASVT